MGFIPIILTLSGASMLFFMVVNFTLKTKQKQLMEFHKTVGDALKKYGFSNQIKFAFNSEAFVALDVAYLQTKRGLDKERIMGFDLEVRKNYQSLKLLKAQYNKTVKTKPYHWIANLMGYKLV